jgi:hypothetical protein
MEKVVGRTRKTIASPSNSDLLALARERVGLPDVDMELDYQDDVDTLVIKFKRPLNERLVEGLDDDTGVLPIYSSSLTKLVGIEILDVCGRLHRAEPS